jgi:hypothetical protein
MAVKAPLSRARAATQTTSDITLLADSSVVVGTSTLTRTWLSATTARPSRA